MLLKDLLKVCFVEMLVFDATDEDVMYNEPELVVNHEDEKYADYFVQDITTIDDTIYVAISRDENPKRWNNE